MCYKHGAGAEVAERITKWEMKIERQIRAVIMAIVLNYLADIVVAVKRFGKCGCGRITCVARPGLAVLAQNFDIDLAKLFQGPPLSGFSAIQMQLTYQV